MSGVVVDRETVRLPAPDLLVSRLARLGQALIPWAVLLILLRIAVHYHQTGWFFGQ